MFKLREVQYLKANLPLKASNFARAQAFSLKDNYNALKFIMQFSPKI
jgi:hypothetical protein